MFPRIFGEIAASLMLDALVAVAREWQPDLLLHDAGELAAPIVGSLVGCPT
jgi:glycosyltransferase